MAVPLAPASSQAGELAETHGVREPMRWFTREKQWVNEMHLQLCRIPAPTFLEQTRAEWFASQFRTLGWHSRIDSAGNVAAVLDPDAPGPFFALSAHLDTVLAPRAKDDISIDRDGDFRGPGVSDNGAGLAALLALAKAIRSTSVDKPLWRGLLLIANVGEEGEGDLRGIRYFCQNSDFAGSLAGLLVLDGAAIDHITTQALGSRRFEVLFSGPGGHSWSDYGIGNPVHALSRAISLFVDHAPADPRAVPRVAVNAGVIEGGSSVNAIPASARAKVDIRSESNEKLELLVSALHSSAARAAEFENARLLHQGAGRVTVRVREIGNRPAARIDEDSPLVTTVRAVDAWLGIRARFDCASTDANIPLSMGIPAVSIGAGGRGGGAHTPSEWYRPAGRDLGLKRILLTTAMILRDLPGSGPESRPNSTDPSAAGEEAGR